MPETRIGPNWVPIISARESLYLSRYKGNDHRREHQNTDDGKDDLIAAHASLLIRRAVRGAFLGILAVSHLEYNLSIGII
jgi:hypothetical protein